MKMRYGKKDVIAKQYHEGKTIHYIIFSNDKGERLYGIDCTKKSFLFWARASDEKSRFFKFLIREGYIRRSKIKVFSGDSNRYLYGITRKLSKEIQHILITP